MRREAISPTTPGCQRSLAVTSTDGPSPVADLGVGLGRRLLQHHGLDRLALAVEPVELGREPLALRRVVAGEQPRAERRVADPAAGIDPRAEQEAEMIGRHRSAEPGHVGERGEAAVARGAPWPAAPWRRRRGSAR